MAPKDETAAGSFNPKHAAFIKDVFANMTAKPDTDWDGVAQAQGLKDAKCAKERFRQICKINGWNFGDASGGSAKKSSPTKVKKTAKRASKAKDVKAEAEAEVKDEDDDEEMEE